MKYTVALSIVPASLNRTRGEHWAKTKRRRQQLRDDLHWMILSCRVPAGSKIHATAELSFPQHRRRDEGNFRTELEKALGDTLTAGGWIPDDTPEHFTFGELTFIKGPRHETRLYLEVTP